MKSKKSSPITAFRFTASIRRPIVTGEKTFFRLLALPDAACSFARCHHFFSGSESSSVSLWLICFFSFLFLFTACSKKGRIPPSGKIAADRDFQVRVLLLKDAEKINLHINSASQITSDKNSDPFLFSPASSQAIVSFDNGSFIISDKKFSCSQLTIAPEFPLIFNLNGKAFRGKLQLIANLAGNSFDVINIVPLESYLAGVIGSEMPSYWEGAALEAQSVCSRTYCLYIKRHFGNDRNWDVTATQANQVYGGVSAETQSIWRAVNKTKGQVLLCKQADGTTDIFPAYFSSSCGGHTENSRLVFGGDSFDPLQGVFCPYCQLVAKPLQFFWSDLSCDKSVLSRKLISRYPSLENLETIAEISPVKQTDFQIFNGQNSSILSRITSL